MAYSFFVLNLTNADYTSMCVYNQRNQANGHHEIWILCVSFALIPSNMWSCFVQSLGMFST